MRIISSLVTVAVLFQSLFIANGLLGICIMEAKALCTCNHSSKREIHANPEDGQFSSRAISFSTQKSAHSDVDPLKSGTKILPNCHSAKSGEAHLCSCKKQDKASQALNPHLQSYYNFVSFSFIKPLLQKEVFHSKGRSTLLSGTFEEHFKPPKNS